MPVSLKETQALSKIADVLYRFLPGNPHPYATSDLSFPGVASRLNLLKFWPGGSKKPAIIQLLQGTLEYRRELFCNLILEIIRAAVVYQSNRSEPITRDEIVKLNRLIAEVNFKIPELWDPSFLDSLPISNPPKQVEREGISREALDNLRNHLIELVNLNPQQRGFAFEKFLNELFKAYDLDPRSSFRIIGEQIDGSFQLGNDIYLVEAKWHDKQIDQSELLIFHAKVAGKSEWSRGLFVSYSGYTPEGLIAFSKGRPTNMIGMDSQDLFHILNGEMTLVDAIIQKARRAAETGEFFVSVFDLSHGS